VVGRQPLRDAAIQTCLTLKALFGLPLRQTTGLVASLIELARLDWPVPDFSTLCRRQKGLTVQIPRGGSVGLNDLRAFGKWISALVTPLLGLALAS